MIRRRLAAWVVVVALVLPSVVATPRPAAASTATLVGHRMVTYVPTDAWGASTWQNWRPSVIDGDLARVAALQADTVRMFAPFDDCYPQLCSTTRGEIADLLARARHHGVRVYLTLWTNGPLPDVSRAEAYVANLVAAFGGATDVVAGLEVFNEIDQVWNDRGWADWARTMTRATQAVARGIPVTLSVSGSGQPNDAFATLVAAMSAAPPDAYAYHYYYSPDDVVEVLSRAQQIAGPVPVVVEEAGRETRCVASSSGGCSTVAASYLTCPGLQVYPRYTSDPSLEPVQAQYLDAVERGSLGAGLGPAGVWMLNDVAQQCGSLPEGQFYGLFRMDGQPKPAAAVVERAFATASASSPGAAPPQSTAGTRSAETPIAAGASRAASATPGPSGSMAGGPNDVSAAPLGSMAPGEPTLTVVRAVCGVSPLPLLLVCL